MTVESTDIVLRTNVGRDTAARLANEMQRTYDLLARYALPCAAKGHSDNLQVTVLPWSMFMEYAPQRSGGYYLPLANTWLADYEGQIVIPVDLRPESRQVFQHEVIHRLVATCLVRVPTWLTEGLASFFETMVVESGKVTIGRPPYVFQRDPSVSYPVSFLHNEQRVRVLPMSMLSSVESVVTSTGSLLTHDMTGSISRYATAWALVHFLMLGAPDLNPRFEAYLTALRIPGANPRLLFETLFRGVPLQDRLNAYVSQEKLDTLESTRSVEIPRVARLRVEEMREAEGHVHLAWLGARVKRLRDREEFRLHLTAAKQDPRTRDAAYLIAAMASNDVLDAEREVREGLRGATNPAPFLEAHLDILLGRGAPVAELTAAADRLKPLATTAGQLCSLAQVALRLGDRKAAHELAERGLRLNPRLVVCRIPEAVAPVPAQS